MAAAATAQTQNNHLKLYLGFELAQRPFLEIEDFGNTGPRYKSTYNSQGFYALAFSRAKTNGDFWEISGQTNAYFGFNPVYDFTGIDSIISNPVPELGKERNNYAQLQFEYNWLQSTEDDRKVRPYLGLFLRASSQWAEFRPANSNSFPLKEWSVVLSPGFVPRLLIKSGKRWHLDLSAPIVLGYFGLEGRRIGNPALTDEQQRSTNFDLSMLTLETQIRLGISYALGKPATE
jgi:hypothetical protein